MKKNKIKIMCLDGEGGGRYISKNALNVKEKLTWICTDFLSLRLLFQEKLLPESITAKYTLLEKEPRAMTITLDDSVLSVFKCINLNKGSAPEEMISVRIWATESFIVTVHQRPIESTLMLERLLLNTEGPKSIPDFLQSFLSIILERSSSIITEITSELDAIEDTIASSRALVECDSLNSIRKKIILFKKNFIPQSDALKKIKSNDASWLKNKNNFGFDRLSDENIKIIETLSAEQERSRVIYEEIFMLSQERLNRKIYLIALVSVIFIPLTFLTGLLGVNVGGMPGATSRFGFISLCGILLLLFVFQCVFLIKKRWV